MKGEGEKVLEELSSELDKGALKHGHVEVVRICSGMMRIINRPALDEACTGGTRNLQALAGSDKGPQRMIRI